MWILIDYLSQHWKHLVCPMTVRLGEDEAGRADGDMSEGDIFKQHGQGAASLKAESGRNLKREGVNHVWKSHSRPKAPGQNVPTCWRDGRWPGWLGSQASNADSKRLKHLGGSTGLQMIEEMRNMANYTWRNKFQSCSKLGHNIFTAWLKLITCFNNDLRITETAWFGYKHFRRCC